MYHTNSIDPDHGFINIPASDELQSYQLFNLPIIRSDNDKREYRLIKLENQLQVILVHDPNADKAAAALSVNVGHLSDPDHLPGLAHFCEHLLFMGNEKYPSENEYSEYLAKHSGYSNAYTGMDDTVYYFEVHPSALDGSLDRFSQFFIAPLFTSSCTEREIRAVDSENSKNLQSDNWRMFQLDKHTSSKSSHSFWKFGTGNLISLWERPKSLNLNIRNELLKFYNERYSSNIMTLAVLGKDSLDDLIKMVLKYFSQIPNKALIAERFDGSPYTQNELKKLICTQLVKDNNLLELTFPMEDEDPYFDTQPSAFLSHYIGHEGVGSATSYLKGKGWVRTFQCGPGGGATGFGLFKITLDLTSEGLIHYKEVVQVIFAYLDLLRSTPPQEWSFKEQAQLSEIRFKFKSATSPGQYVTSLASWIRRPCPREQILSSVYLTNNFDSKLIQNTINKLIPENSRLLLASQNGIKGFDLDLIEPWYNTPYSINDLPEEIFDLKARKQILNTGLLQLPKPNTFVSNDFFVDIKDIKNPTKRPNCLKDDEFGRVWHKKDDRWWVPRASIVVMIRNPTTEESCLNTIKVAYVHKILKELLNESLYEAEIAGLGYSIHHDNDALIFNVDGYQQKLSLLLETILNGLKNLKEIDQSKFDLVKDHLIRRYQNFMLDGPVRIAGYWLEAAVVDIHYNYEEKLEALEVITPADIEAFIPELLSRGFVETLVHGNLNEEEALQISDLPRKIFNLKPVPANELRKLYSLTVPPATNLVYERDLINPSNMNSAVNYFIDLGDLADHSTRTKLSLLAQLIHEPAFNQLRTQEQLGYIVQTYTRRSSGQCGLMMMIQSERTPTFIESRIEAFLDCFLERLINLDENEFEEQKKSLVNKSTEDFKNLWEESSHYWVHIQSGYYAFERRYADAELIKQITKKEMIEFYKEKIHPSSSVRSKVSVQVKSQKVPIPIDVLENLINSTNEIIPEGWQNLIQSKPTLKELSEYLNKLNLTEERKSYILNSLNESEKVNDQFLNDYPNLKIKPKIINKDIIDLRNRFQKSNFVLPVSDWKGTN
ncbi:hypothetical protein CROQUDRAFT_45305 [Cronartium quercuum f. sp. fusiforme G11]|uniref:Uncharacterized protein n=1 Tax=Cronartium quercuum f. sp. fusiforme G11 TaxID=708437 RepID=A0A9P6TB30_9BASI|nr:hypothetical protein CROQUDRAFT_45305 [Cronartium quercuum f. sp. fusiforme G11]